MAGSSPAPQGACPSVYISKLKLLEVAQHGLSKLADRADRLQNNRPGQQSLRGLI
jgi:hypothetical protein